MTTRDAVSVVGTANHEDYFAPWSCTSMYQLRTLEPRHNIPSHLAVDCPKNHIEKRKEKHPILEFYLQTSHVVIQNLYRSSTSIFVYIYFIQARRTGYAALKWQAIWERRFRNIYSYSNYCFCFVLAFIWSRAGMLWRVGRLEYLKHFVQRRDRSQRSLSLG